MSMKLSNQQEGMPWAKCIAQVQFIKLKPEPITDKNIASLVQVTSMHQSPIHSLHQLISSVYAPLLLKDSEWSQKIDPGVQKLPNRSQACYCRRNTSLVVKNKGNTS